MTSKINPGESFSKEISNEELRAELEEVYQLGKSIVDVYKGESDNDNYLGSFADGPNPLHGRTEQGFVLEPYYCKFPSYLHTPWGCWTILESGRVNKDGWDRIEKFHGLKLLSEEEHLRIKKEALFYAVTKTGNTQLPRPIYKKSEDDDIPYQKIKEVWKKVLQEQQENSKSEALKESSAMTSSTPPSEKKQG